MVVRILAAIVVAASVRAAPTPGQLAPDTTIHDGAGAERKLSEYRDKMHVVVLVGPDGGRPAISAATVRKLGALDTVAVSQQGPAATVLVDKGGFVRRVLDGQTLAGSALEKFVDEWHNGKGGFVAYCARCHGEDGDAVWCDPKPLIGIGQRMSPDQVRARLNMTELDDEVLIRGERIKKADIEPIIVYVRSL